MLSLVSDNGEFSKIDALHLSRVATTPEENDLILAEYPPEEIISVTARFQARVEMRSLIPESQRPTLNKFLKGPFCLAVQNQGTDFQSALLSFELETEKKPRLQEGSIESEDLDITSKSIAAIPFLVIFNSLIEKEWQRAEKLLIKGGNGKVSRLDVAFAQRDREMILNMTSNFHRLLDKNDGKTKTDKSKDGQAVIYGKEAVFDNLASGLSASRDFYESLWSQMEAIYSPTCRYLGEQCALGKINLKLH